MKRFSALLFTILLISMVAGCNSSSNIEFVQGEDKIDVNIDGKLFTSYVYKSELVKPILWPIYSPLGVEMTRGFPYKEVEGEAHDHPHHTGIFFTYDMNKNGIFWNSPKPPPQIKHVEISEMKNGTLSTVMNWTSTTGKVLLQEDRTMVFSTIPTGVAIDMTMKLTAKDTVAVFEPTKEGMLAIRVAHWLKERGNTGEYLSSNGDKKAENVWGKRAEWVTLQGNKEDAKVGIAIMNHPSSENSPTYWHARNYGLFSANPLGQDKFQAAHKVPVDGYELKLQPGESALFKFKVLIYDGHMDMVGLDRLYTAYAK
jgi:hypothetical protein